MAIRGKMSREDRAKQFMPFAALKGYEQALRQREKRAVSKSELSEDKLEELNYKLQQLKVQDLVTIVYYNDGEYLKLNGMVSKVDMEARYLKVVNTKIPFSDIYELNSESIMS